MRVCIHPCTHAHLHTPIHNILTQSYIHSVYTPCTSEKEINTTRTPSYPPQEQLPIHTFTSLSLFLPTLPDLSLSFSLPPPPSITSSPPRQHLLDAHRRRPATYARTKCLRKHLYCLARALCVCIYIYHPYIYILYTHTPVPHPQGGFPLHANQSTWAHSCLCCA